MVKPLGAPNGLQSCYLSVAHHLPALESEERYLPADGRGCGRAYSDSTGGYLPPERLTKTAFPMGGIENVYKLPARYALGDKDR